MTHRKGIILAGGSGSRLYPITKIISKHLLPIYDKPMIYYAISTLMLANIREILIISTYDQQKNYKKILKDGSQWGLKFKYKVQKHPNGIAEAFILARNFINNSNCALILGDNFFYGDSFSDILIRNSNQTSKSTIFSCYVSNPTDYGVLETNKNGKVLNIKEKPKRPKSNYVVTGLYFYDSNVSYFAKSLKKSNRNELEITDLNNIYLKQKKLNVVQLSRGFTWFDTGTFDKLVEANVYVKTVQSQKGLLIGCLEEIALSKKWVSEDIVISNIIKSGNSNYNRYVKNLIKNK